MAELKINFKGTRALFEFGEEIRIVTLNLKKAQLAAALVIANTARDRVKEGYTTAAFPRTAATIETYSQGKSKGRWPKRDIHAGSPMNRTDGLAKYVRTRALGTAGYQVEIDPSAVYRAPSGEPSDWSGPGSTTISRRPVPAVLVAEQLENPTAYMLRATQKMLGYLQSLRRGTAGHPTGRREITTSNRLTGVIIVVRPEARPVWKVMTDNIHTVEPEAQRAFLRALRKQG